MNYADGAIILIIVISVLISIRRGFTREALSLVTWIAAFVIARLFSPALEVLLEARIETPSVRIATAFGVLFAATLVVGAMISHLLAALVTMTGLDGTDRLFGTVFGAVRGALLVIFLVAVLTPLFSTDDWWQESVLVPQFAMMENWTRLVAAELWDTFSGWLETQQAQTGREGA